MKRLSLYRFGLNPNMFLLKRLVRICCFCLAMLSIQVPAKEVNSDVALTHEEIEFIKSHPEIVLGVGASFDPFVIKNHDGSYSGHDIEMAQLVAERTGLKFSFQSDLWANIRKKAQRREVDGLLTGIFHKSRAPFFNPSHPYVSFTSLVLVKKGNPTDIKTQEDISGKTVAMQTGNLLFESVLKHISDDVEIVYYDTIHEVISAVVAGSADLCILDETAPYLAKKIGLVDFIEIAFPVGKPFDLVFLIRKDWPELVSIVNKGLASIGEKERIQIRDSWFGTADKNVDYVLLAKLFSFVAVIFGILLYWSYTLRVSRQKTEAVLVQLKEKDQELEAKNKILEALSVTDSLTHLSNREKLDSVLAAEILKAERYQTDFGVIMIDIDFFKQVNDTYGHQTGDTVLIEIAGILKTYSRRIDTIGRWGGEEFLIICPHTNKDGLVNSAEKLRHEISKHKFSKVGHKTASFGVAVYAAEDSSHSLIAKADQALYLAKNEGRNRTQLFEIEAS